MWNIFKKKEKSKLDLMFEKNLIDYEDYKYFRWNFPNFDIDIEQYNNLKNICYDISSLIWGYTVKMLFECINSDGNYDKVRCFSVSKYLELNNKKIEEVEDLYLNNYLRKTRCEDHNHFILSTANEVDNKKLIKYHDVCYSIKEIALDSYMIIIHCDNIIQGFEIDDNAYILTDDKNIEE